MNMKYIGANGVSMSGGSNFGSGLGFIPESSLQGLGGMGNEISGTGALGSFGNMNKPFGVVGLGQEQEAAAAAAAAAANAPAPQSPQVNTKDIEAIASDLASKRMSGMVNQALLYGGLGLGAYFLYNHFSNK